MWRAAIGRGSDAATNTGIVSAAVLASAGSTAVLRFINNAADGLLYPGIMSTVRQGASEKAHAAKDAQCSMQDRAKDTLNQAVETLQQAALPLHHVPGTTASTKGARFTNPWPTWEERGFMDAFKWQRERKKKGVSIDGHLEGIPRPTAQDFARAFPLNTPDWHALANPATDGIQALWVGHATVLVQMAGLTFITDPVLSQRCSPVQWFGPKRVVQPALQIEDPQLPHIDAVLLSHNHYDHLDEPTVNRLYKRFGNKLTWYVPLGVKQWFSKRGITNVHEMDWWQELPHQDTKARITFVPAQHWSARGVHDRRNTLWGGYVVKTKEPELSFYFAGDTGYCDVFKEIGSRLGPMDCSAIPIGAYEPRWFMRSQHVDAEEGLQVHRDVQSKRSLAIHCCTWSLTDEPLDEPPRVLAESLSSSGGDPDEFVTLQHGEMLIVKEGQTVNTPKLLGPRRQESESKANKAS